jgi:flagellar hook-length control protein FliK
MSAPKILPSQSTSPGGTAATSATPVAACASPFDAILMLEELAASAAALNAAGIDAGAAELGAEGAESADDMDGEDSAEDGTGDGPLAFLAGLIAVAPAPHSHARAQSSGSGASGEGGGESSPLPGEPKSSAPLPQDPSALTANTKSDAAAARALAAQAAIPELVRVQDEPGTSPRGLDLLSQAPRTAAPGAAQHAPIATHARDPRWADDFGARIATLVNQRESVASISLTPVDLGPVDVSVTVRDSQATIHFGAAQAETRALIEASLPKLRELLAAQGFQLMDASVSQGFQQSRRDEPSVPRPTHVEEVTPAATHAVTINGLLDTYA